MKLNKEAKKIFEGNYLLTPEQRKYIESQETQIKELEGEKYALEKINEYQNNRIWELESNKH